MKLKDKRIFIVEDNVANLAVFSTLLRKEGAEIFQDSWNTGTVNLLNKHLPIDLILLDIMLNKGRSGYELFQEFQQDIRLNFIPVVGISSLDPELEIPKAKKLGFAGFISKPIQTAYFVDQILACLNGQKVWDVGYK